MELFELMEKEESIPFPDNSLLDGLVTDNKDHLGHDPDESRQIWVNGGFLHGYLNLFKMQYDEVRQLLKLHEKESLKQKKINAALMKELRQLNENLQYMKKQNEQITFEFNSLAAHVRTNITLQDEVLARVDS